MQRLKKAVTALSLMAFAACGGAAKSPDKATDKNYQGEPLFTVKGQMLTSGAQPSNPIHLAVAWYPDQAQTGAPTGIVTQDVPYTGSFPLNYSFSFFSTPPQSALTSHVEGGQTYKYAWGILLAYEDLNGNGQLDTIPVGGSPVDHILGTTIGDYYNGKPAQDVTYVAYVDGSAPPSWTGFSSGFNLWKNQQVVPQSTQVPLNLDNTNELDFLVCEEFISGTTRSMDLPCNIAPTGGVRVTANVYLTDGQAGVSARITDGTNAITNATVELNGKPVPYGAQYGMYYAIGGGLSINPGGDNVLKVTPQGGTAREFHVKATADFTLHAPISYSRVKGGTPVQLQWSAAAGAWFYDVRAYRAATTTYQLDDEKYQYASGLGTEAANITMPNIDAWEQLEVVAFDRDYLARGLGGSTVNMAVLRSATLDVIPATAQLGASGTVTAYRFSGQDADAAYFSAFDGISEINNATLTLNGQPVTWNAQYKSYALESAGVLVKGAANTLVVKQAGKPDFTTTIDLPADFSVNSPPSTVTKGSTVNLSWTAAAGADGYQVWAVDMNGTQLFYVSTDQTSIALNGFDTAGQIYLNVAAFKAGSDRHIQGNTQNTLEVTVTP